MLEIFRVVMTNCDADQRLVVGGVEQMPRGIWGHAPAELAHWPVGTALTSLHSGAPRSGVARIARDDNGGFAVTDVWGHTRNYPVVLITCQSWLLTTAIECDESLFSQKMWTALDRTRYMQSSKTAGLVRRGDLATLNHARRPAVLVELGQMTNPADARLLSSGRGQNRYATAVVDALRRWAA